MCKEEHALQEHDHQLLLQSNNNNKEIHQGKGNLDDMVTVF